MIYQNRYDELIKICKQITTHRQVLAKPKIEELTLEYIDVNTANEDLLSHLITESLLKRIDRQLLESKNIYIQQFDIPQTTMFYSMAEAVPFVFTGHNLANQYLEKVMNDLKTATLFDIGIAKGLQVEKLLFMLAKGSNRLEKINIIGLDPVEDNLTAARKNLEYIRDQLPFVLNFHSVCNMIENLTDNDYDYVKEIGGDNILINSAFTLHHTSHPLNDREARTDLIKKLAGLKPLILTLVEPHSNHDTEELTKRLHYSWQHFGTVFKLVDEADIDISHKFLIKEKFFGREIRDIFGVSDHFRCERHELYDSWLLRLNKAGFKPVDFVDLKVELPPYCKYTISEGLVRMDYNDTTVVSVFAYTL